MSWCSGKDSAYALYEVLKADELEVVGLVTTVSSAFGRVSMHGVREVLLDKQAEMLGLPLHKILIPTPCPNEIYEREMTAMMDRLKGIGVEVFIFGDLFLEDIRSYRLGNLKRSRMEGVFPLWLKDTKVLAREMIRSGFKAKLTCVDSRKLSASFAGREFDETLLGELPGEIDPCGENGEFHTFVYGAPIFKQPIAIQVGQVVDREGFIFADLLNA